MALSASGGKKKGKKGKKKGKKVSYMKNMVWRSSDYSLASNFVITISSLAIEKMIPETNTMQLKCIVIRK